MKNVLSIFLLVSIGIFILFFIDSIVIGGDVINAIVAKKADTTFNFAENCYYVISHGNFTEVSHANWIINAVLEYTLIIMAPFAIIIAIILALKKNSED